MSYHKDGTLDGHHRFTIGGNNDGIVHQFDGTYHLDPATGIDGTYGVHDVVADEHVTFYFVLTDNDNEIQFMGIDGAKGGRTSGRSISATGVQKRIHGLDLLDRGTDKQADL